jgi:hypothetical protein
MYVNHGGKKTDDQRRLRADVERRTEGHGNKAVNDGEDRERARGE